VIRADAADGGEPGDGGGDGAAVVRGRRPQRPPGHQGADAGHRPAGERRVPRPAHALPGRPHRRRQVRRVPRDGSAVLRRRRRPGAGHHRGVRHRAAPGAESRPVPRHRALRRRGGVDQAGHRDRGQPVRRADRGLPPADRAAAGPLPGPAGGHRGRRRAGAVRQPGPGHRLRRERARRRACPRPSGPCGGAHGRDGTRARRGDPGHRGTHRGAGRRARRGGRDPGLPHDPRPGGRRTDPAGKPWAARAQGRAWPVGDLRGRQLRKLSA
jgi:hypothetical protein